jgi:hypothetical protein
MIPVITCGVPGLPLSDLSLEELKQLLVLAVELDFQVPGASAQAVEQASLQGLALAAAGGAAVGRAQPGCHVRSPPERS